MIIRLLIALLLFIPTAQAATINAVSNSLTDVQAAINDAGTVAGDTVVVPAGTGTADWTGDVDITKAITLQGPGKTALTITWTTGQAVEINQVAARVTGFGFSTATAQIAIYARGQGWRVDNCKYNNTKSNAENGIFVKADGLNITTEPYGLVDSNEIINGKVLNNGMGNHNTASAAWYNALDLGGSSAVYVEDNTFSTTSLTYPTNCMDSSRAAKYVFRYNTALNTNIMVHAIDSATASQRGGRKWEVYGNTFNSLSSATYAAIWMRSGTGISMFNDFTSDVAWNYDVFFDNPRSSGHTPSDTTTYAGTCDGDSQLDGNDDASGYPCRDQIGYGLDTSLWSPSTNLPAPDQTAYPGYIFLNRKSGSQASVDVVATPANPTHIQANRDYYNETGSFNGTSGVGYGTLAARPATCTTGVGYWATSQNLSDLSIYRGVGATPISGTLYKCTSTDTWTAYYTPYTYPHPMRTGSYLLTVTKAGAGSGTVTSNVAGIDCGATCSYSYASGTVVTLTATAGTGNTFDGWSGEGCSGTGTCQVTMSAAKSVTATFSQIGPPNDYNVFVSYAGLGEGTTNPASGSHTYTEGGAVSITATPGANASFSGWSGTCGCTGTGNCNFNMPGNDCTAIATFADNTQYTLNVTYPSGSIIVYSDSGGIHCGDYNPDCSHQFYSGTVVSLTSACPLTIFSGDCIGPDCTLTMSSDKNVTIKCGTIAIYNASGLTAIYNASGMTGQ